MVEPSKALGTFLEKVKRRMEEEKGELFLESLEILPIDIPLVDTLKQTPKYTKCLQELVSNKTKFEEVSTIKLNARCSTIIQNQLPPKEKDPGSITLPCLIGCLIVSNSLADLVASISDLTSHLPQCLFDVSTSRISIVTVNTMKYHSDVLAR
ncbi:hypothetical protein Tco_1420389 [Tanacetum coccineum]